MKFSFKFVFYLFVALPNFYFSASSCTNTSGASPTGDGSIPALTLSLSKGPRARLLNSAHPKCFVKLAEQNVSKDRPAVPAIALQERRLEPVEGCEFQKRFNKKVLLLYTGQGTLGGTRSYKLSLYKNLTEMGFNIGFFIVNNPDVRAELDGLGLSYYACDIEKTTKNESFWEQVHQNLRKICKDQNIGLINCNKISEVKVANLLAKEFDLKTVLTMHIEGFYSGSFLKLVDGVLAVSPHIADQVKMQNKTKKLGIKNIEWTAPFFNSEKFFNFKSTRDKKTFFKNEFDINVTDAPIITMVANFLDDSKYKDHPVLLRAVAELVHKRNINIQVMLAGQGPYLEKIKGLAKQLNVSKNVHFLGRTDLIPELFYHSNMKVLASKSEAFGIVLLEAALMHCPLIGTSGTGMENVIKHGKTGLLFKKGDVQDLADKIEKILKDTKLQKNITDNAFDFVCENFLPEIGLKKIINFYLNVMG